jgi:hypothetical protein
MEFSEIIIMGFFLHWLKNMYFRDVLFDKYDENKMEFIENNECRQ